MIVPMLESFEAFLNAAGAPGQQHDAEPKPEGPEESLDLGVDGRTTHTSLDVTDAERLDSVAERLAELAAVIRDEETWSAVLADGVADQPEHLPGVGRAGISLKGQELSGSAVDDGGDGETPPQQAQRGQIEVPDAVGAFGPEQVAAGGGGRRDQTAARSVSLGVRFAEDALDGRPADAESGADEMRRQRPRAEFGFGAEPAQFMDRPAHRIVEEQPGRFPISA